MTVEVCNIFSYSYSYFRLKIRAAIVFDLSATKVDLKSQKLTQTFCVSFAYRSPFNALRGERPMDKEAEMQVRR